jgi:hypothetical protein
MLSSSRHDPAQESQSEGGADSGGLILSKGRTYLPTRATHPVHIPFPCHSCEHEKRKTPCKDSPIPNKAHPQSEDCRGGGGGRELLTRRERRGPATPVRRSQSQAMECKWRRRRRQDSEEESVLSKIPGGKPTCEKIAEGRGPLLFF